DEAWAENARLASDELRSSLGEPSGVPGVVPPVRYPVSPPEDTFDVDIPGHRLRRSRRQSCRGEDLDRAQQRLRGQARVIRAFAARQLALDDDDLDVLVEPAERTDEVLSGRAGAEDDDWPFTH